MIDTKGFCQDCRQGIMFPGQRGPMPRRCPRCKLVHEQKLTAGRVRRHRMNKDPKDAQYITVHIQSCDHKAYCGRPWTDSDARATSGAILSGNVKGKLCKTCIRRFDADMGGGK